MNEKDIRAAHAAKHCTTNDIEDFDDANDFLSEKVYSIVRILIPDGGARVEVMAQAFAKCFFDEAYTGEPFDDIELAKDMVGECLAGIIIDNDPMLYTDFCKVCGDEYPDDGFFDDDDSDESCNRNLCGGDCDRCPYRDDIPRYVYETVSSAGSTSGGISMTDQYELIPTSKQRGSSRPPGWVQLAPGMNPKRRTMTEGYLNQRMPRGNTVAMNQNYVSKVFNNPKTPRENREVVIAYVLNHPEKFTPLADQTDDQVQNEWAFKRNGNADFGFMRSFRRRYM